MSTLGRTLGIAGAIMALVGTAWMVVLAVKYAYLYGGAFGAAALLIVGGCAAVVAGYHIDPKRDQP